jgi:hypothetical protein
MLPLLRTCNPIYCTDSIYFCPATHIQVSMKPSKHICDIENKTRSITTTREKNYANIFKANLGFFLKPIQHKNLSE